MPALFARFAADSRTVFEVVAVTGLQNGRPWRGGVHRTIEHRDLIFADDLHRVTMHDERGRVLNTETHNLRMLLLELRQF